MLLRVLLKLFKYQESQNIIFKKSPQEKFRFNLAEYLEPNFSFGEETKEFNSNLFTIEDIHIVVKWKQKE